jgi:hypothetical protein
MSDRINYDDKVALNDKQEIAEINKHTAENDNEIKSVVNSHADDIEANQVAIQSNQVAIQSISSGQGDAFETRALAMVSPGADNVPFVVYGESGFNGQYRYLASDPNGYVLIYLYLESTNTVEKDSSKVVESGSVFSELNNTYSEFELINDENDVTPIDLTINSLVNGSFNITRGRTYPWILVDTDKYEFVLNGNSKYLVIGYDSDSVLAVTLDSSVNSCRIFRFTNSDGISGVVTNLPNNLFTNGSTITAYRVGTVLTIYEEQTLKFTYDYSISSEPEFSNPSFGNVFTADGNVLTGVKTSFESSENRLERLENEVFGATDTTEMQGEKMADVGDSIMDQNGMQPIIISRFGIASNQSLAVSGKKFVSGDPDSITEQIQNITNDPKLILIGGGTNDFGYSSPLGNIGSSDTTEFYGAVNFVADYATTNYPNARIIALTLPFGDWQTAGGFAQGQTNSLGLSRYEYEKAQIEVYRNYGIRVVKQLSELDWNLINIDVKTYDRVHPSTEGSEDRANAVSDAINKEFSS